MRRLFWLLVVPMSLAPGMVQAQSEVDRLREALRSATSQVRSLEDQRAVLQAKQFEADRDRDRLRKQNTALRAQVKEAEQAYRQAVKDFNERLEERDQTLEKWKSAYGEAAAVARAKESERAKLEREATTLTANNKACEAKNARLVTIGHEIVNQFESMSVLDKIVVHEELIGHSRVQHQNRVQEYRDKVLEQSVKP